MVPSQQLSPQDFLHFFQLDGFADDWEELGFDTETDLPALEIAIMTQPEAGAVVQGTDGLRKIRFARASEGIGKRSGVRVCYVYFKEHWTVLLVAAYAKNVKDDLTSKEKRAIADYIERARVWLAERDK